MRYFAFCQTLALGLAFATSGCSSTSGADADVATSGASTAESTARFLEGLASPPGSSARAAAGDLLGAALARADAKSKDDIAYRVVSYTVEYLKKGVVCSPKERITLYRGFGRQPLFRKTGAASRGFALNNVWLGHVIENVQGLRTEGKINFRDRTAALLNDGTVRIGGDDLGNVVMDNVSLLSSLDPTTMPWPELLHQYKWDDITSVHTTGEDSTILISTTLTPKTADHFGPGILTLSVCPERALVTTRTGDFFNESEVYVPFFILPEEIVKVDAEKCGQLEDRELRKKCQKTTFSDPSPARTEYTKHYRQCFFNFDTELEQSYMDSMIERYEQGMTGFYNILMSSPSVGDFRRNLSSLPSVCPHDCERAKQLAKTEREAGVPDKGDKRVGPEELAKLENVIATSCR